MRQVTPLARQTWTVSAVLLNMAAQGMLLSHTTCLLPALQLPQSSIRVDLLTASWLASSAGLAGIPGFQLSAVLMNIYGRRITHMLVILPGVLGWLVVYWAQSIAALMVGRILGGISAGASVALGAIVIGEYSNPKYRGVFLNLKTASVNFGSMLVHIMGHYLTWRIIALICVFPQIISIIITFTWVESPPWLASKGKFTETKRSFQWLRENTEASNNELEDLIRAQREKLSVQRVKISKSDKIKDDLNKFSRKDFLKPLCIMLISSLLLEASGRHIYPAYASQIIGEVVRSKSESFHYILGIDIIITISTVFSSFLVKIMKRRTLLFSTGFMACAVLMIACAYIALIANKIVPNDQSWLAIGVFVIYFVLVNLGCTPIPLALLAEVFPLSHRELGSAIVGISMSLSVMVGLQVTPYLLINLKMYGTFFILGIIMLITLLFLYFMLPETKDKTLQQIEDYFNNGKFSNYREDQEVQMKILKNNNSYQRNQ